jgi:four helix bundle protein
VHESMHMAKGDELRGRTKVFAIRVLRFLKTLPNDTATLGVARQLAKSGPSISANYHSAGRSRSRAEFKARLGIVVDEADETVGWLELLKETRVSTSSELEWLLDESRQLRAIFLQASKTARINDQYSAGE